jgi:hypothetical protein
MHGRGCCFGRLIHNNASSGGTLISFGDNYLRPYDLCYPVDMPPTNEHASSPIITGNDTSFDTNQYSLTLEQAKARLAEAGVPRNDASIARFCRKGKLDGHLAQTSNTRKYFINEKSLQALISELRKKKNLDVTDTCLCLLLRLAPPDLTRTIDNAWSRR